MTSKMSVKSSNPPPSVTTPPPSRAQVSLGPYIRFPADRRDRAAAPPDEQAGQIQTVVGVQMRQQDVDLTGVGVALQGPENPTAEVDGEGGLSVRSAGTRTRG